MSLYCTNRSAAFCTLTAIIVSLLGCSNAHELETAEVTGVVSLDGRSLESGSVLFLPMRGRAAIGIIQPDGTYSLTTYQSNDGAIVGSHSVTVSPYIPQNDENAEVTLPPQTSGSYTVTKRFSGISANVESGKVNQIPIEIKSETKK